MRNCNSRRVAAASRTRAGPQRLWLEQLEERLPLNSAWQNPGEAKDVNNDSIFDAYDVRTVLADALIKGARSLVGEPVIPWAMIDVDGDQWCTQSDIRDAYSALLLQAPVLAPQLAHDTGHDDMDRVTADPAVFVGATSLGEMEVQMTIQGSSAPPVDVTAGFADRQQTITPELLEQANGGPLTDGHYTVVFYPVDEGEIVASSIVDLSFVLDTTPAPRPTVDLAWGSDTGEVGDHQTALPVVDLAGVAPEGYVVELMTAAGDPLQQVTLDAVGDFSFFDVPLVLGDNDFCIRVTDHAGNTTESLHTFRRVESGGEGETPLLPLDGALAEFQPEAPFSEELRRS